jgi:hypothetical protein
MFVLKKKTEGNFRWQTSHRHLHSLERQPEGVQVVEGVGLVASDFQFSQFDAVSACFYHHTPP